LTPAQLAPQEIVCGLSDVSSVYGEALDEVKALVEEEPSVIDASQATGVAIVSSLTANKLKCEDCPAPIVKLTDAPTSSATQEANELKCEDCPAPSVKVVGARVNSTAQLGSVLKPKASAGKNHQLGSLAATCRQRVISKLIRLSASAPAVLYVCMLHLTVIAAIAQMKVCTAAASCRWRLSCGERLRQRQMPARFLH
jgi:Zn finger protein HypA/HybF involved in hydrogenase expression